MNEPIARQVGPRLGDRWPMKISEMHEAHREHLSCMREAHSRLVEADDDFRHHLACVVGLERDLIRATTHARV